MMPAHPKKSSLKSQISHYSFLSKERKEALLKNLSKLNEQQLLSLQKILETGDDRLWTCIREETDKKASRDTSFATELPRLLDQALRSLRVLEEKMDRDDESSDTILSAHS